MVDRIAYLLPEITLFITVCIVMLLGTSCDRDTRRTTQWVAGIGLFFAMIASGMMPSVHDSLLPDMARFVKMITCAMGLLLLLGMGSIDANYEAELDKGTRRFDPLDTSRGEFLAFFLLSIMGVMLCTVATDLVWLFLALELTSLPTYVMVASSRGRTIAHEAAVKYFYLGAMAAAVFLYGFALMYGATGSMQLADIRQAFLEQQAINGHVNLLGILGVTIAILGIAFKIAAFPMHFYTADVYDGAATQMSAFLAFVPKTAGFVVIMLIISTVFGLSDATGASMNPAWPNVINGALWLMAVLTMTVGNTLAILQHRTKRILAYSSIAHSGYMLIGIIAGPMAGGEAGLTHNGFAAILFYLLAYGMMNVGAFLVLACLEHAGGEELEVLDDLRGIARLHPWLSGALAISAVSLIGLPPLIGFFGKLYLFAASISAGQIALVVIAGLNSAVSAWYYLKLAGLPWLASPTKTTVELAPTRFVGRKVAAVLSACGVIVLVVTASPIMTAGNHAAQLNSFDDGVARHQAELMESQDSAPPTITSDEHAAGEYRASHESGG